MPDMVERLDHTEMQSHIPERSGMPVRVKRSPKTKTEIVTTNKGQSYDAKVQKKSLLFTIFHQIG